MQKSINQSKSLNCISGVMVSVPASCAVDLGFGPKFGSNQRLKLVFVASPRSIKEKKQGLVGSESE